VGFGRFVRIAILIHDDGQSLRIFGVLVVPFALVLQRVGIIADAGLAASDVIGSSGIGIRINKGAAHARLRYISHFPLLAGHHGFQRLHIAPLNFSLMISSITYLTSPFLGRLLVWVLTWWV
jgi:hypothetical protein